MHDVINRFTLFHAVFDIHFRVKLSMTINSILHHKNILRFIKIIVFTLYFPEFLL